MRSLRLRHVEASGDDLRVDFNLYIDDIRDFVLYTMMFSDPGRRRLVWYRAIVFLATIALGFMPGGPASLTSDPATLAAELAAGVFVGVLAAWFVTPLLVRAVASGRAGTQEEAMAGHWTYTAGSSGLSYEHKRGSGRIPWSAVDRIEAPNTGVYIFTSGNDVHVIPGKAFADSAHAERFAAYLRAAIAGEGPDASLSEQAPQPDAPEVGAQ